MSEISVAAAVGRALPEFGVRHLFGLIGSGNFDHAAAAHAAGVEFVGARHESGAVAMADGYARATGRVGVATVHQGPGFTNALTPLVEAAKGRSPVVLLAADTATGDRLDTFFVEQGQIAAAAGALVTHLHAPDSVPRDLVRAFARAEYEQRASVILLPVDVQGRRVHATRIRATRIPNPPHVEPDERDVIELAERLGRSRRPVLLCGRGALRARSELEGLATATGALLTTSAQAKGLFRGHPYDIGVLGTFTPPSAAALLAECDLLVAFGASINRWTTRWGGLLSQETAVVHVDVDAWALGAHHRVDQVVLGDVAATAAAVTRAVAEAGESDAAHGADLVARAARRWIDEPYDDTSGEARIDPRTFTIELNRRLPEARTVVCDSGHFLTWPARFVDVPDPHGWVFTQAFQSIGLGLGNAIGAAFGRGGRVTVLMTGDGGLLMSAPELETVGRLRLPVVIVVYNDAAYGAEVHGLRPPDEARALVEFPETDFAAVARSFGLAGATVRSLADLAVLDRWLAEPTGPLLLDVKIDPTVAGAMPPGMLERHRAHDGTVDS